MRPAWAGPEERGARESKGCNGLLMGGPPLGNQLLPYPARFLGQAHSWAFSRLFQPRSKELGPAIVGRRRGTPMFTPQLHLAAFCFSCALAFFFLRPSMDGNQGRGQRSPAGLEGKVQKTGPARLGLTLRKQGWERSWSLFCFPVGSQHLVLNIKSVPRPKFR